MIAHSFTVRLLSSGQLECLSAARHILLLGARFPEGCCRAVDGQDNVFEATPRPWLTLSRLKGCCAVVLLFSFLYRRFFAFKNWRPDLQTWEWKLDSDILKVRSDLLEKRREGNLDTSRRTFKSLREQNCPRCNGVWPSDTQGPDKWNHWAERMRASQSKERTTSRWQVGVLSDTKEKSES